MHWEGTAPSTTQLSAVCVAIPPPVHQRKMEESNPYSYPYPGFQDQLPTIQRHLPEVFDGTCSRQRWRRISAITALAPNTTVESMGIEPITSCLQGRRSNHLSYDPIFNGY